MTETCSIRWLPALAATLLLAGCGGTPVDEDGDGPADGAPPDIASIPSPTVIAEPRSKYGNPPFYEVNGKRYYVMKSSKDFVERGIASWYGRKFHGRRTSSGEVYNMYGMTAAHKKLPLPTFVSVKNLENGRELVLRVNDRGPFHANRIIDLSYTAASKLGVIDKGTAYVEVRALEPGNSTGNVAMASSGGAPPAPVGPPPKLYLQVGAFAVESNATRLAARLEPVTGRIVRVTEGVVDGNGVYRVRLGPLAGVEQADALTRTVEEMGLEAPRVVLE